MNDLLTIGEYAAAVGLSVSAVRFYADRGLLHPAHIDPGNGYRFFAADQVETGCLVRDLRLIGLPLADVRSALGMADSERHTLVHDHIARLNRELGRARDVAGRLGALPSALDHAGSTIVEAAALVDAFQRVLPFSSTSEENPDLMTVLIESREGSLRVVTTDTWRLGVRDLATENADTQAEFTAVVPAAAIRRWLPLLEACAVVELTVDDGTLVVRDDGRIVAECRLVRAMFPDYESVLAARTPSIIVTIDRTELLDAFSRFGATSEPVDVTIKAGAMQLRGDEQTATVACDSGLGGTTVALDPSLTVACVASAVGPEVVVEIANECDPVAFRSATNGTGVSLLMPVKR